MTAATSVASRAPASRTSTHRELPPPVGGAGTLGDKRGVGGLSLAKTTPHRGQVGHPSTPTWPQRGQFI